MPKLSKNSVKGTPRPAIADLLKVPRDYKPVGGTIDPLSGVETPIFSLVDETQYDFSRDELILKIGKAYPEFVSLVKEFELALADKNEAQNSCRKLYELITRKSVVDAEPLDNWMVEVEKSVAVFTQSWDVLQNIADNVPTERAKDVASKQVAYIRSRQPVLVNESYTERAARLGTGPDSSDAPIKG